VHEKPALDNMYDSGAEGHDSVFFVHRLHKGWRKLSQKIPRCPGKYKLKCKVKYFVDNKKVIKKIYV